MFPSATNAISGLLLTGTTVLGAGTGYAIQEAVSSAGLESGWIPTFVGAATGALFGTVLGSSFWLSHYNPLPRVYKDLTRQRYEVLQRYDWRFDYDVVKAQDRQSGRLAVLKMPRLNEHPHWIEERSRLLAEVYRQLSEIDSPHLVRLLSPHRGFGYCILVMEHIPGLTLNEYLKQKGKMNFAETLEVALAIAKGLGALHKNGYAWGHYPDSSFNVILHPERKAVLIDPAMRESQGPNHEMDEWAGIVKEIWSLSDRSGSPAEQLRIILNRAKGEDGFEKYTDYDALIGDLEAIPSKVSDT